MRSLVLTLILCNYIAIIQAVSIADLQGLYFFVRARLNNISILYQSPPKLDYDADISDYESTKKHDLIVKKVLKKKLRKKKKTKNMSTIFADDISYV